ncbi:MAG: hypothetical protein KGH62_04210, partial [Candidatus Micrarchaeota archaeon]|nr:hypothetical protein [Candidatus Micrarchaeota archaeon]
MAIIDYLKDRRIIAFILILVVLALLDYRYGLHLGVEFAGGTQIPITLQQSVTPSQMNQVITILQQRLSTFGLRQISIEGVGTSQILVTIPSVSQSDVASTVSVIQSQGVFQGIVNGKVAINGSSIIAGSAVAAPTQAAGGNASWSVNFYVTPQGGNQFSRVAFGQANKPLYMFLDRPIATVILLNSSILGSGSTVVGATGQQEIAAIQDAVAFGNKTIPVELLSSGNSNWGSLQKFFAANKNRYHTVILSNTTPAFITSNLTALNYSLSFKNAANMTPVLINVGNSTLAPRIQVDSWPAIGLLSSPLLNPGVTNGSTSNQGYVISGSAPPTLATLQSKINYASNQSALIQSVLSGGALPVHVIVGVPVTTPPTLGASFENISIISLVLAVLAVSIVIVIRYAKLFLIVPILLTTLGELFIIISVIGLIGTIDLAAIAGMIAVIGTGVDAQIIISDELLSKTQHEVTMKSRLSNAFY